MKIIDGAFSRAIWKRLATSFSLSPIHLDTRSDDEILRHSRREVMGNGTLLFYASLTDHIGQNEDL